MAGLLDGTVLGLPAAFLVMAAGAMLVVMLAMAALLPSDSRRLKRRVATVAGRGAHGSAGRAMPAAAGILLPGAERGDGAFDQLLLKLLPRPEQLRLRLQRAGLSTDLRRYLAAILIAGAATSATLWLMLGLAPFAALLFGLTGGIAMPQLVLGFLIRRRKMRFLQQFPEALDLVVRGLRSGLPVTESMKTVSTEVPDPVGGEFRRIVESLAIGNSLEQAMWAAATRIDITDFNFFVVSLQLQRDTGGNLAETLENLADVVRRRRQLKLKIKAISAEGRASAYIIGLLPFAMFGVIWMTSPSYLGPLLGDVRGHIMLGVAVVWLLIGVAVMARMVRFEILTGWLENLPFGLTPEGAITSIAGLTAVLAVLALWLALTPRRFGAARARALVNRRAQLKAAALAPRKRATLRSQDLMRQVVERMNLLRGLQADKLAQKLARAGYRSKEALIAMFFAKATVPAVAAAIVAFVVMVLDIGQLSQRLQLLAVLGALVAGYFLPDLFVYNQATRRQMALRKSLPDALDLMVICAEAGLSLDAAFQRVARELGRASREIGDEFGLTAVELGFMPDRRRALENLSHRTGLAGVQALVGALVQTEKYGTPLAQSLRVLSAEQRNERIIRAEEKAARLPAIMTVPLVFFILPPLFVVLMGPAVLNIIDRFINR